MPGVDEHEELRDTVARVLAAEDDPVRQVAAGTRVAAVDAVEGWTSLAFDLRRAAAVTADPKVRRKLERASSKASQLAKLADQLARDTGQVLAATAVGR